MSKGKKRKGNKKGKAKKKNAGYNPNRNRYKTNINHQIANRCKMGRVPIEVTAFVKLKYCQRYPWRKIYSMAIDTFKDKIPGFKDEFSERRMYLIYENNSVEFKKAREEYTKKFQEEFNADREQLLDVSLKSELKLAEWLSHQIDRLTEKMDRLDPTDPTEAKMYNNMGATIVRFQKQQQELTNTDRFRRLEETKSKMIMQKEILGDGKGQLEDNRPSEIKIVGEE